MLKKYSTYLPDLTQSWILVALLALAGSLFGALVNIILVLIFPGLSGKSELMMYPLIFIPPLIVINKSVRERVAESKITGEQLRSIPIDNPQFGKIGAVATVLLTIPLVFSFNIITEPLSMWMGVPEFFKQFLEQIQTNRLLSFVAVAIFAPVLEEIFCRGIILRGLLTKMDPFKAIFWSALIFGVMHMNPWQALPAFLLGLLMGWIYYKTHSLWIVILIHFINNGFSYLVTVLFPELPPETGFYDLIPGMWYYIAFAMAFVYTGTTIYLMNRNYDTSISFKIQPHS